MNSTNHPLFGANGARGALQLASIVLAAAPLAAVFVGSGVAVEPTSNADDLAAALASDEGWIVGGELETSPSSGASTGIVTGDIPGLASATTDAIILSTGRVTDLTAANDSESTGTGLNGEAVRGDTDFDVTILRVDLDVPDGVNCLTGIDFTFLSEEFPEYLNSEFNDGFIAELGESTWTTKASEIIAPDNFAFDPEGNIISVNATGPATMAERFSDGTTFDAATPVLRAAAPITPGRQSLFLSIFDQGDSAYDSAVIIGNLRLGTVEDVTQDCEEGVELASSVGEPDDVEEDDLVPPPGRPPDPEPTNWAPIAIGTTIVLVAGFGAYRVLRRPDIGPSDPLANVGPTPPPNLAGRLGPATTQSRWPDVGPTSWRIYIDHARAQATLTEEHP